MKFHYRILLIVAIFSLCPGRLNAVEGSLTEEPKSSKQERQAFLSPAQIVIPPAVAPGIIESPIPTSVEPEKVELEVQAPIERTEPFPASPLEKAQIQLQRKIEQPISPLPLPETPVPPPATESVPVPLPGRVLPTPIPEPVKGLEPVIVTATKTPVPADRLATSVSVLSGDYLKNQEIRHVSEALRDVPGVTVSQFGGPGRQANLFIRGSDASHNLVLVDGVKVNSPTSGDYNFVNLSTDLVDRIEVVKGPQSTLYGSEAVSGVVNIITKKGTSGSRFSSHVEYGTLNTLSESLSLSNHHPVGDYALSVSRLDTDGLSENDEHGNTNIVSRLGLNLNEESRIETSFRFITAMVNIEDGAFRPDPNRYSKSRQHIFQSNYQSWLSDRWEQKLSGSFFHDRLFSLDIPNPASKDKESRFKLDSDIYTLEWQHNYYWDESNILTGGYQWTHPTANNKSFDQTFQNHGFYLQDQISLKERWFLTGGVRFDHHEVFGASANPRFSIAHLLPQTETKLKGTIGTGFKAPTLNQLYFPNFGNPDLGPEESLGYDLGIEQKFFNSVDVGLTYFHNRFRDLIESRPKAGGGSQSVNVGRAKTEGVELTLGLGLTEGVSLCSFYNFLIAEDLTTGAPLRRRPKHSGGISLGIKPWDRFGLHLNTTLVGDRQDASFISGRPGRETNPGYMKMDLVASYEYHRGKKIYTKIENLTNSQYDEAIGFGSPGTTFTIGNRADF